MKRLALRLSITAVFLACGVIAIAQSLRTTSDKNPGEVGPTTAQAPSVLPDTTGPSAFKPPKFDQTDRTASAVSQAALTDANGQNRYGGSPAAAPSVADERPAYNQNVYGGAGSAPSAYGQGGADKSAYGQDDSGKSAYGQDGVRQSAYGQGSYGQGSYGQDQGAERQGSGAVVVASSTVGGQSGGGSPATQVALSTDQSGAGDTERAPVVASLTDDSQTPVPLEVNSSTPVGGAGPSASSPPAPSTYTAEPQPHVVREPSAIQQPAVVQPPAGSPVAGAIQAAPAPAYSDQVASSVPVASETAQATVAVGTPGNEVLEGAQRPSLTIEKHAPREIQVDSPVTFEILVKNEGRADALDVMIVDSVPQGTQLIKTTPTFDQKAEDGSLVWRLGTLKSGESRTISIELMPLKESEEIGSVARVLFEAHASVKTRCTKPELVIEGNSPEKVMIGDDAVLEYTIVNRGTGAAKNVVILEDVPIGFTHAAGKELEYEIGTLRPNERYPIRLKLRADEAKLGVVNVLRAKGEGRAIAEKKAVIDIVAPQLAIQLQGPTTRYLNRKGKYQAQLINSGTAPARNVDVVVRLPKGVRYVESKSGQYDDRSHLVYWNIKQLDPQQQESFELTVTPTEIGSQRFAADAQGNLSSKVSSELETSVDGLSELTFSVIDVADPIELGDETTYEILIQNIGTKSDSNINLIVALPKGIQFKSAQGATRNSDPQETAEGQLIQFAAIAKMGPNQDAKFRITVAGEIAGSHRIRVQVSSDEAQNPVTREESTRVLPADGF
jgi:uncharacterized repeat protein (TIGR01451 family)